ncbi:dephospho-CoA kinase [Amphritea japonica]|uniref:Dephospho-CoA kinase n=1 Tax=Amphritea japonica ATCC BAA-1530 TaxID=1278309 RepID=A0A7R6PJC1_9GAMM|nr:dephospho-CoA kinase [Amphritea japonica]BBB25520.1 dephospho-CoA kinase [Amphritea japonica ATCC BAA-1530]
MFVAGLTGGIGSGKTAVSQRFELLGICVVDADIVAREVVQPGEPALDKIIQQFGEKILLNDGNLDRTALRKIVFDQPEQRDWLEQLLHPIIRERILQQLEQAISAYAILASPLLLETDQHLMVDHTVVVDVDEATQINRTTVRDDTDSTQVRAIIAAQMPRLERIERADSLIDNSGPEALLQPKVESLHHKLIELAQQKQES